MTRLINLRVFKFLFVSCLLILFSCTKQQEMENNKKQDSLSTTDLETPDTTKDAAVEMITDEDILLHPIDSGNGNKIEEKGITKAAVPKNVEGTSEFKNNEKPSIEPVKRNSFTNTESMFRRVDFKDKNQVSTSDIEKEFSHSDFDDLLKKYVTSTGKVNYSGFMAERSKLQVYLKDLKNNVPNPTWSKNKKLAYWINVYNANTIELILKYNIPKTIMSINGGKAWDLAIVEVGTKKHSLNQIEHDIIRKQFGDPRIHFACVCAAKSCPKLLNTAYTEFNLNTKLDEQTKNFINNPARNQISDGDLKVSELFNWYKSDFGDVNAYIRKYYDGTFKDDKKIEFLTYDWTLNN